MQDGVNLKPALRSKSWELCIYHHATLNTGIVKDVPATTELPCIVGLIHENAGQAHTM